MRIADFFAVVEVFQKDFVKRALKLFLPLISGLRL